MYCPQCRVEYRDGFFQCANCHVALAPGTPPDLPVHEIDMVTVFETGNLMPMELARASLEDAGIPFWMDPDFTRPHLMWFSDALTTMCRFLVPRDRAAEARELLGVLAPQGEDRSK